MDSMFCFRMSRFTARKFSIGDPWSWKPGVWLTIAGITRFRKASLTAIVSGRVVCGVKRSMKGIAVSSGSACSANQAGEPSYALTAMGLDPIRARGSLRITLGRFTTANEVDEFLNVLPDAVGSLRTIASHAGFAVRA